MANLQKAAAAINYKPTWLGLYLLEDKAYQELAGANAEGTYYDSYLMSSEGTEPPVAEYRKVVGKLYPDVVDAASTVQGWSYGELVVKAVEKATENDKKLTRKGFLAAMNSFKNEPVGLVPSVSYDKTQHFGGNSSGIFKISNGKIEQALEFQPLEATIK
jgi:ABC-type branched-subunit amino acid transport system substrate-binding protein